ncbi:MAG: phosphomannomutase/phosphoglucomutase [Patescibacteria group bacterium]|nr:phosphomannomutase/phosphoglucomutase [Patescibacteria group bacterium]
MKDLSAIKAYDIRGKYPEEVNEELAYLVGRAFSKFLSAGKIVIGMDMRKSSVSLKEKVIEGLSCEGVDVFDIGLTTTPMLNFAVRHYQYDGGVMISASHDPGEENGIKLIDATGIQLSEDFGLSEIKDLIKKGFTICPGKGTITQKEILADYLSHLLEFFPEIGHQKVVVDYSNGVGAIPAKPLLARTDLLVTELNEEPDGTFPAHPANPHDMKNLKELMTKVKEEGADLGFFFDGDADRVQVIDEEGQFVPMDLLFILLAREELLKSENKGQEYYFDLRFSKAVPEEIKKLRGKPVMMRVGNPFYKKALASSGVIAAEYAGHVMYRENSGIDDGLFCALKVLKLLNDNKKSLSELIAEVKKYETSDEVSLKAKNNSTVYDDVRKLFPKSKEIDLDGLYLDLPDGFVSVRQSQTQPEYFRIRVEAKTKKTMEDRLEKVVSAIGS